MNATFWAGVMLGAALGVVLDAILLWAIARLASPPTMRLHGMVTSSGVIDVSGASGFRFVGCRFAGRAIEEPEGAKEWTR